MKTDEWDLYDNTMKITPEEILFLKKGGVNYAICMVMVRCSKKGLVLPIELALFSELWLGPRNGLGPIEVFPKAPFSKGSAI